jgi:hypothetical protein
MIALLCGLLAVSTAMAMDSDNFAIEWDVLGGGEVPSASDNFAVNGTIGQTVIGASDSVSYAACLGYWCGAAVEHSIYLPLVLRAA